MGHTLNRVARLLSAAHGGQTLLSRPTCDLVGDALPATVTICDLGEHRLKDLQRPEMSFRLSLKDFRQSFPAAQYHRQRAKQPTCASISLFIGREKEVEALCSLSAARKSSFSRLRVQVALGQTRLALQVAAELIREFHGGAFFISLASITDLDLVIPTIAQALDI